MSHNGSGQIGPQAVRVNHNFSAHCHWFVLQASEQESVLHPVNVVLIFFVFPLEGLSGHHRDINSAKLF